MYRIKGEEMKREERMKEKERGEGEHTVLRYSISLPSSATEVLFDNTRPVCAARLSADAEVV